MDPTDIGNRFKYYAPKDDATRLTHEFIWRQCLSLASDLNDTLPEGREKSLAITNLEQAMFWANAAIARS